MRPYLLFVSHHSRWIQHQLVGEAPTQLLSSAYIRSRTKSQLYRYHNHNHPKSRTIRRLTSPNLSSSSSSSSLLTQTIPIDGDRPLYFYGGCFALAAAVIATTLVNVINTNTKSDHHNMILSTSPFLSADDATREGELDSHNVVATSSTIQAHTANTTKVYDFIIVGYGTAGRSALKTLQHQCPNASIAVIDPFLHGPPSTTSPQQLVNSSSSSSSKDSQTQNLSPTHQNRTNQSQNSPFDFYSSSRVTEFDPVGKECVVVGTRTNFQSKHTSPPPKPENGKESVLQYRHAILIATGCRGAPIPSYLIDEKAQSRTYEYRPTIVPTLSSASASSVPHHHNDKNLAMSKPQRPFTSPDDLRKLMKRLASGTNETIAVLGSGWDALDLIANVAIASSRRNNKINHNNTNTATHAWIYGSYGPVSSTVPNYLSVDIAKRLQSKRITILDRSLIRYISFIGDRKASSSLSSVTKNTSQHQSQLQVYTAKSYDFLDGKAVQADYVVVAPDIYGARGTGAFPTLHIPSFLQDDTHNHSSWYHTWSSITTIDDDDDDDPTSLLSCYKDDGRIAVNTELYACHDVFAAGSVAKYPNGRNGNATVAGCGVVDATNAGYIAAMNMSQLYDRHSRSTSTNDGFLQFGRNVPRSQEKNTQIFVKDPIPIWRSDLRTASVNGKDQQLSSLEDVGIVALCVGNCDAESLATHGVWWTNHAAHRRLLALAEMNGEDVNEHQQRRKMKQSFKPIYGFGVVFYLDRANKVHGVMTWGLPFYRSDKDRNLDEQFVEQIKHVIKTNGGFRTIESEQDRIEFTRYLGNVSKEFIVNAFSNHGSQIGTNHQLNGKLDRFPRPLHRYTEIRPPNIRVTGLLKRNDGQNLGILGQDLFVRFEQDDIPDNPIPLPLAENLGSAIAKVQAQYDWDVWEQVERRWDENEIRARPSKEDPLWIRKGDEGRAMSHREKLAAAYNKALTGQ